MVLVWDTQLPERKAWEMSEHGFQQLNEKYPGRYKIKEQPKVIVVEKKSPSVVVPSKIIRVPSQPTTKRKPGKS